MNLNWVKCSNKMPVEKIDKSTRDFGYVLCATTFGDVRAYKYGNAHFWHGAEIMDEYVTHWMPMPEMPKEE